MLPFTDIDFFLFALLYVVTVWLFGLITHKKHYPAITFALTLIYFIFYFRYTMAALGFALVTFLYIRFLSQKVNHRLVSAIIIAIPMVLLKVHLNPSFLYFAGLSFITFRAIQVSIDYSKDDRLNFMHYFNFLFFIPSFYIGPLDRYKRFTENSVNGYQSIGTATTLSGLQEFIKGVTYKFIVAELISRYWLQHSLEEGLAAGARTSDIYAYAFYLFFDFAGYSSMAVGMANLVGISLPFNFNKPFIAINPPDFWQRWHASLTSWLGDYFFKPFYKWLNGFQKLKKNPIAKQNLAIFFTLFIMGIWNGFESNFIWSGIIYGIYSVIHNTYVIQCRKKDKDVIFGNLNPKMVKYISIVLMFHLICIALYVFSGRYQ
ncbi:MAG: MBOAT family O-acyltransferase [Bacteroidota bacterium]